MERKESDDQKSTAKKKVCIVRLAADKQDTVESEPDSVLACEECQFGVGLWRRNDSNRKKTVRPLTCRTLYVDGTERKRK